MSCDIRHIDSYLVVHKPGRCSSSHSPSLIIQITMQETDSIRLVEKVKQGSSADATTNDCYPDWHDIYARLLSTYHQLFFPTISILLLSYYQHSINFTNFLIEKLERRVRKI